jgi:hypothetical protein
MVRLLGKYNLIKYKVVDFKILELILFKKLHKLEILIIIYKLNSCYQNLMTLIII